jgi:hypothetical protein
LRIRSLAGVIMGLLRYSATARRALERYTVTISLRPVAHLGHAHGIMVEPVG